MIEEEI